MAEVYKSRTGKYMSEEMLTLIWSVAVSIFAFGGMIGGLCGGAIADYCGRKCGLLLNNAIVILGATLMSSSHLFQSIECLIMGRFFIGLSCGLNTALVPMYSQSIGRYDWIAFVTNFRPTTDPWNRRWLAISIGCGIHTSHITIDAITTMSRITKISMDQ
ncbi:glucose transporter-like protein [Sarcoptes scabiei]|uniref:Glucose transporter-like protein n=1 Tax=Sarcoptes scabiei TaxID=52283 RepID=A0A131ZSY9_SARSC|nr:glucose transporter-like protein [Sarcoptes scabiei]